MVKNGMDHGLQYNYIILTGSIDKASYFMKDLTSIRKFLQEKNDIDVTTEENIIDYHTTINWGLWMSKEAYDAQEKAIQEASYVCEDHDIYAWGDGSGYDYWVVKQEEDNYVMVTVKMKTEREWSEEDLTKLDLKVFFIINSLSI